MIHVVHVCQRTAVRRRLIRLWLSRFEPVSVTKITEAVVMAVGSTAQIWCCRHCQCSYSCLLQLLAREEQAKLALIVAQIYPSVHLCVCPRQLESMGALYSSKFCSETIIGFFS